MFKNLATGTKLFILCGVFVLATCVAIYGLVAEKLIAIDFARKELAGNQYLTAIRRVYAAILTERSEAGSGPSSSEPGGQVLMVLAGAEAESGRAFETAELEEALTATLRKLWSSDTATGQVDPLVPEALAEAQTLAVRVGDDSNLTLDPEIDTYYIQNIIVSELPALLGHVGELDMLTRVAPAAAASVEDQRVRFLVLANLLESTVDSIRRNLERAYRGNPDGTLRRTVSVPFATMLLSADAYVGDIRATLEGGGAARIGAASLDQSFKGTVASGMLAWTVGQNELGRLLRQRIDGLVDRLQGSLLVTGLLLVLSIVLAVLTDRHIVKPLQRFERVAKTVRETKDYSLRVDESSHDEIGRLAAAFNEMLAELSTARQRERQEQAELARLTQLTTMGAMTASIAHEINQPLAAIVSNANAGTRWLNNPSPDLDEARAALKRIVSDGHRASQVIGGVRAIFKKDPRERSLFGVNELIEEVLPLANGNLEAQRVSVQTDLREDLPDVLADRVQLQQVLLNLVTNGIDAMSSVAGRTRLLQIKSDLNGSDGILISVTDSGTGIDPKDMDKIFGAFFTTKASGMGLGLSICRSIVEAHGGRLWASSANPHGAVFNITLPRGEAPH